MSCASGNDAANTDNAGPSSTSRAPPTTATAVMPSITFGAEQVPQRERQIVHRADEVRRGEAHDEVGIVAAEPLHDLARDLTDRVRGDGVFRERGGEAGSGTTVESSRQSWTRRRTSPTIVRGTRPAIGVRDGRRSSTVTGTSATPSPARSARSTSSVSKRSVPLRHRRTMGSTVARRIAFIPWVSDTWSPKPTRSTDEKPAVMARRGHGRVSFVPGARFEPTTMAGPPGCREGRQDPVDEAGVVVVDVEHHHDGPGGGEDALRASPAP